LAEKVGAGFDWRLAGFDRVRLSACAVRSSPIDLDPWLMLFPAARE